MALAAEEIICLVTFATLILRASEPTLPIKNNHSVTAKSLTDCFIEGGCLQTVTDTEYGCSHYPHSSHNNGSLWMTAVYTEDTYMY